MKALCAVVAILLIAPLAGPARAASLSDLSESDSLGADLLQVQASNFS